MSYAGSYNGFTFGDGQRPGASVASLTGWRTVAASYPNSDSSTFASAGLPDRSAPKPRLRLNLHASSNAQLLALIDAAVAAFVPSLDPLPLTIDGRSRWVQVVSVDPESDPSWAGEEVTTSCVVEFVAVDPVQYSATQATETIATGDPQTSVTFEVANDGSLVQQARHAWEFRMTAHGTVTNPTIRVDHADGTFEQVLFQGTMTGGQVLTVGADLVPRVGSQVVSGWVRSTTESGGPSRGARWWLLHPSDGADEANEVTMSVASGSFSGFCKTRSTW